MLFPNIAPPSSSLTAAGRTAQVMMDTAGAHHHFERDEEAPA
jgi:hypothetical protein